MQVLHPRATPAENGLVVVAHHERRSLRTGQEPHPPVLDRVGVLELVHQHVLEPSLVLFAQLGALLEQFQRPQQQLAEVHHRGRGALLLIPRIEVDKSLAQTAAFIGDPVRAQALVLLPVDEPLDLAWRIVVLIQAQALEHAADQEQLVPGIDDLESFRQPRFAPVNSQQPVRQAMERADPEVPRGKSQ